MAAAERITEDAQGNLVVQQGLVDVLNAIRDGQTAGFAEIKVSLAHQEARIAKLERAQEARANAAAAVTDHRTRVWSRREKVWGAIGGFLMLGGVWFGNTIAALLRAH